MGVGGVGWLMIGSAAWWIEAHPGLVLGVHVAVIVGGLVGMVFSVRALWRMVRPDVRRRRLAAVVGGGLGALALVVLFTGGTLKIGPRLLSEARVLGEDASQLRFVGIDDGVERRIAADGREVVVVLWATWCKACIDEFEPLSRLHARGDVKIVHLSLEDPETIRAFLSEHPELDFGSEHGSVAAGGWFPAARMPTALIVGGDGRIAGLLRGTASYDHLVWALARVRDAS